MIEKWYIKDMGKIIYDKLFTFLKNIIFILFKYLVVFPSNISFP